MNYILRFSRFGSLSLLDIRLATAWCEQFTVDEIETRLYHERTQNHLIYPLHIRVVAF